MNSTNELLAESGTLIADADTQTLTELRDWHVSEWRAALRRLKRAERNAHHHKYAVLNTAIRIHGRAFQTLDQVLGDLPF